MLSKLTGKQWYRHYNKIHKNIKCSKKNNDSYFAFIHLRRKKVVYGTLAGIGVSGILAWKYVDLLDSQFSYHLKESHYVSTVFVTFYALLPLKLFSKICKWVSEITIPSMLRVPVYSLYSKIFDVNLDECKIQDLNYYRNFSEFFIRPLNEKYRPVDNSNNSIVSPADGTILSCGKVVRCQLDQIKGVNYSLQHFFGKQTWFYNEVDVTDQYMNSKKHPVSNKCVEDGSSQHSDEQYLSNLRLRENSELFFFVVYLSPGDYHRFHSPISWKIHFRRHFQGYLLSVNPKIASWIHNLFALNERVIYIGKWEKGFFALAAVGASCVGSIKVQFDPLLCTNRWISKPRYIDHFFSPKSDGVLIEKGDLFGNFKIGSTIVLIFEAPLNFNFNVSPGQKIKYGEKIGSFL